MHEYCILWKSSFLGRAAPLDCGHACQRICRLSSTFIFMNALLVWLHDLPHLEY